MTKEIKKTHYHPMDFKIIQFVFLFFANLAPLRDKLFSYSPFFKGGTWGISLQNTQDLNLILKN